MILQASRPLLPSDCKLVGYIADDDLTRRHDAQIDSCDELVDGQRHVDGSASFRRSTRR
jgi:hypothetical protein